jgi:hypothetical protein
MIILQETATSQTIKFIPREWTSGATYRFKIHNEMTNKNVYNQTTTSVTENLYFKEYSATFSLKQGVTYTLTVENNSDEIIYRDKIFCTNQSVTTHSVNDDYYTTVSSTNEFITI